MHATVVAWPHGGIEMLKNSWIWESFNLKEYSEEKLNNSEKAHTGTFRNSWNEITDK